MSDIRDLTLADLAAAYRNKALSPVEVAADRLAAIETGDGALKSFITLCPERTMDEARKAEAAFQGGGDLPAMTGIPYGLKDIVETAGLRTTGQSRSLADHIPAQDAFVAARLRKAGAVLMGKNTTWEFAHGGPSWDVVAPPAHNARNPLHHPAGSSSGTGAAIAEGFVACGIGTDTGGSIRLPAAACGIVGLKPTYGRVSRRGVFPNSFSHDHAGPMARTCRDAALMLQTIAGHDPMDPGSADRTVPDYASALTGDAKGLTIGVPRAWLESATEATVRNFEQSLAVLAEAGAIIVDVTLPSLKDFGDCKKIISMAELFAIHGPTLRRAPDLLGDSLRYRIQCGALIRAEEYIAAQRWRTRLCRAMSGVFATVDLIATPTMEPAGLLEPTPHSSLFKGGSFTTPFNTSGSPAVSLCSGLDAKGLPQSLQLAGRPFDEATVLRAGDAFERLFGRLRTGAVTDPATAWLREAAEVAA